MTAPISNRRLYGAVFLISAATLMVEILLTRLISVVGWYHFAFFMIALAMLGMSAGALLVALKPSWFPPHTIAARMGQGAASFGLGSACAVSILLSIPWPAPDSPSAFWQLLALGSVLALPFSAAGITLTLGLTRAGLPENRVYAVDLVGAALGCVTVIPLLERVDAPSAALLAGALAGLAALLCRRDWVGMSTTACLFAAGLANAGSEPAYLRPRVVKSLEEDPASFLTVRWNSYSRITVEQTVREPPYLWANSRVIPSDLQAPIEQRTIRIDGAAATMWPARADLLEQHAYLDWDITSFVHRLRPEGPAAVIGVGGGRDVVAAARSGHQPILGLELNEHIVALHTEDRGGFSRVLEIPGVTLIADEARGHLARDPARYSVIAMSLIDTWASTGAGSYSLSENGLYTLEAWSTFLDRLEPHGIFTVSRWYHTQSPGETARMLALALDLLWDRGAKDPHRHLVLLQNDRVATLLVSPTPYSKVDIDRVQREAGALGYSMIATPRKGPSTPLLAELWALDSRAALQTWTSEQELDLRPPTDDRPFFFNMLKPGTWLTDPESISELDVSFLTNLHATATLLQAGAVSSVLALATLVWPLVTRRRLLSAIGSRRLLSACAYFLLIGFGFMFVEMGLLSRLTIVLGHPTIALVVLLAGLIASTGMGSLLFGALNLGARSSRLFPLLPCAGAITAAGASPWLVAALEPASLPVQISGSLALIVPVGISLGGCFPFGLRLCSRLGQTETLGPWLWAINGACGVSATALALACSMVFGVTATIAVGAACYLALIPCVWTLSSRP